MRLIDKQMKGFFSRVKKFIVYIFIVCIVCLLGCQPTPEIDYVKQKDSYAMLEKAATNKDGTKIDEVLVQMGPNPSGAFQDDNQLNMYKYEATDVSGKVHLKVDAKIFLPDVEYLPIVRVSSSPFTEADVEALYRALLADTITIANDGPMFKGIWQTTLDDLTEQFQSGKYDDKYETEEDVLEAMNDVMQRMEKEPEKPIPASPDYSFHKLSDFFSVAEILGARDDRYLSKLKVFTSTDPDSVTALTEAEYIRDINQYGLLTRSNEAHSTSRGSTISFLWGVLQENNIPLIAPQIDEESAYQMAEKVMETAELTEYTCTAKCITPFYQYVEDITGGCPGKYEFIYTRRVNGAPETFTNIAVARGTEDEGARAQWPYEHIHIYIDDQGVFAFLFYGKSRISEIINPQATLLPFSEIQSVFEKQFFIHCGDYVESRVGEGQRTYEITEIRLGLQRVFEKDHLVDGLLVPVWSFFGTYTNENGFVYGLDSHDVWFSINAIDGTVIDLYMGY